MGQTVFISCEDLHQAAPLVAALERRGATVVTSPTPGDDRWSDWYADGCRNQVQECDRFVAVVTGGYDSSTWMAHEINIATRLLSEIGRPTTFFFRLVSRPLPAGFKSYELLARELPHVPDDAASVILEEDR